ncbi:MAG: spore maturation protein [Oscillospiraceae bacterium]
MTKIKSFNLVIIPLFICLIIIASYKSTNVYEDFLHGAREGLYNGIKILPAMLALTVTVGALRNSGLLSVLVGLFSPLSDFLKIPTELFALGAVRSLSGSGALVMYGDILKAFGADSFMGRAASVMMASSETTF